MIHLNYNFVNVRCSSCTARCSSLIWLRSPLTLFWHDFRSLRHWCVTMSRVRAIVPRVSFNCWVVYQKTINNKTINGSCAVCLLPSAVKHPSLTEFTQPACSRSVDFSALAVKLLYVDIQMATTFFTFTTQTHICNQSICVDIALLHDNTLYNGKICTI